MVVVRRSLALLAVALATAAVPAPAGAQPLCARPVALVESVKNSVQLVPTSTKLAIPATRRAAICAGDVVRVGDNSRAVVLILNSNTPLAIDQNSEFVLTEAPARAGTFIDLLRGALLFISHVRQAAEIRTPFLNAAIEGTELVVRVEADRTVVTVLEGTVRTSIPLGAVLVAASRLRHGRGDPLRQDRPDVA